MTWLYCAQIQVRFDRYGQDGATGGAQNVVCGTLRTCTLFIPGTPQSYNGSWMEKAVPCPGLFIWPSVFRMDFPEH